MYPYWKNIWHIKLDKSKKIGIQITARICQLLINGQLSENDRLPPVYLLAKKLGTTPVTVTNAYNKLSEDHLVVIKRGIGSFIAPYLPEYKAKETKDFQNWKFDIPPIHTPSIQSPYVVLGTGRPNVNRISIMAYLSFYKKVLTEVNKNKEKTNLYQSEVEDAMMGILRNRGIKVQKDQFRLLPKGMALYCVVKTLVLPGDAVIMDSTADIVPFTLFKNQDAKIHFCGNDDCGLDIKKVEEICKTEPIKLLFIRPGGSYPELKYLIESRRQRLVELSIKFKFIVICMDDNYGIWHKQPLPPLYLHRHSGNIIYISPLSKLLSSTNDLELVVTTSPLIKAIDLIAFQAGIRHELHRELTISRLAERGWINSDSKRLLKFYKLLQIRMKGLYERHLQHYAQLTLSQSGLYIYITFNKPVYIFPIVDELINKGVFDRYKNQHVNIKMPVQAIRIGYANFPLSVWETLFSSLAELCRDLQ